MNKKNIISIFAIFAIGLSVFIILYAFKKPIEKTTIHINAILPQISQEELINQSDGVIVGIVKDLKVLKTSSSVRPNEEDIVTNATIVVEKYISNPKNLSDKEITVQTIGGTIGNETMTAEESPTFKIGEKVIVALKKRNDSNNVFTIYGWAFGKYTVDSNDNIGNEKESVYFNTVFGKKMNFDEFEKEIETIKNNKSTKIN